MCRTLFVAPSGGSGSGAEAEGSVPKVRWDVLACHNLLLVYRQQTNSQQQPKIGGVSLGFPTHSLVEMARLAVPRKGRSWAGPGKRGERGMGANSRRTWVRHTAEGRAPACPRSRHPNKNAPQRLPFFPCGESWSPRGFVRGVVIDCCQHPALALLPRHMPACDPAAPAHATAAAQPTPDAAPCCEVLAPSATPAAS